MGLKEPNKQRINLNDVEWGNFDYDGTRQVLFNNQLYTGYVVYDRFPSGIVEYEVEYNDGSHIGWENEYNQSGILIYSCYSVGQTSQEIYKYDDVGNLLDHYKL